MKNKRNILSCILIFLVMFMTYNLLFSTSEKNMTYTTFMENLEKNKVETVFEFSKTNDKFKMQLKDDNAVYVVSNPQTDEFKEILLNHNVEVSTSIDYSKYITPLIYIGITLFFWLSFSKSLKMMMGEKEKPKDIAKSNKKFKDVIGLDDIKQDLYNVVDMVKNPEKCKKVGAKVPRGILFDGPPGNGKTLLAKALAGECGMSFYSANASEFIEKYVGMGAMRIRNLFENARKTSPSIIFIDEIDSIGCKRTGNSEGADKEYTQCLNAILAEMDGFNESGQILVIAATNRVQDLDEALTRAGRFDMKFTIGKPDFFDRVEMIKFYLRGKAVSSDVKYDNIAKETTGFSCAEIENLVNIAAFKAVERNSDKIEYTDFNDALVEILTHGKIKKDNLSESDFITTCYHEAGHAIMTLLKTDEEVLRISALPSTSGIGGFTMSIPKDERKLETLSEIKNKILVLYAGRAAEYMMNNELKETPDEDAVSLGASSDIERATELIKLYVNHSTKNNALLNYGSFGREQKNIIEECERVSIKLWNEALALICSNFILVKNLAFKLMDEKIIYNYKLSNIDLIS